jgi:hypothetical protein
VTQSHPAVLLTTRVRTALALGLTALFFANTILHWGQTKSGWLFSTAFAVHGSLLWRLMAANVFFYCFACWAAFWLIRATEGPERFFMVGWCTGFVLSPLKLLGLRWAGVIKHIGAVGLAVALLASLALLLKPLDMAHSSSRTDVT